MIIDKKRKPKKPYCLLAAVLIPGLVFAQASEGDLVGLNMSSELAEAITKGISANSSYTIQADNDAQRKLVFDATSDTALTLQYGDGGTTAAQSLTISASTSNADDDGQVSIAGGGGAPTPRGAYVTASGNESSGNGNATVGSGDASGADVLLAAKDGVLITSEAGATAWTFDIVAGTMIGAGTGSVGWVIVDQADNQACNTGCTAPCVAGQDLAGANKPLVSCTDATADICLCAGAS